MKRPAILFFVLSACCNVIFAQFNKPMPTTIDQDANRSIVLFDRRDSAGYTYHGLGVILRNSGSRMNVFIVTNKHLFYDSLDHPRNNTYRIRIARVDSCVANRTLPAKLGVGTVLRMESNINFIWVIRANYLEYVFSPTDVSGTILKAHQSLDLAIFDVGFPRAYHDRMALSESYIKLGYSVRMGDPVIFFGFPFGLASDIFPYWPVMRKAIIAWYPPEKGLFMLDGLSFGGNSGGPVFSDDQISGPKLIGIVTGHEQQQNTSFLLGNIGLVQCIYIDDVLNFKDHFYNTK